MIVGVLESWNTHVHTNASLTFVVSWGKKDKVNYCLWITVSASQSVPRDLCRWIYGKRNKEMKSLLLLKEILCQFSCIQPLKHGSNRNRCVIYSRKFQLMSSYNNCLRSVHSSTYTSFIYSSLAALVWINHTAYFSCWDSCCWCYRGRVCRRREVLQACCYEPILVAPEFKGGMQCNLWECSICKAFGVRPKEIKKKEKRMVCCGSSPFLVTNSSLWWLGM